VYAVVWWCGGEGAGLGFEAHLGGRVPGLKPLVSRWLGMPGLKSGPISEAKAATEMSVRRGYGGAAVRAQVWGLRRIWEGVSRGLKPLVSRWLGMPGLNSGPISEARALTEMSVRRGCGGAAEMGCLKSGAISGAKAMTVESVRRRCFCGAPGSDTSRSS
jgi:hypothetical protein